MPKLTKQKFESLTKAQQRMAIAADVIKQLNSKRIQAKCGFGYIVPEGFSPHDECTISSAEVKRQKSCTVCALGGIFVSACRIGAVSGTNILNVNGDIIKALRPYFSKSQLDEIEHAFENNWPYNTEIVYAESTEPEDSLSLRLIMENIIANNGTFKPKKEPVLQAITPGYYKLAANF